MSKIVDIYCRLQASADDDFAEQETACRQFAESQGFTVATVHRDRGSGGTLDRPELTTLRARCKNGDIQGIIVKNLDRLSRSTPHLVILQQEMEAHEARLYSVDEDLTETMNGRLISTAVQLITEIEREKARDRSFRRQQR